MDNAVLSQILAKAVEANPSLLTALLPTLGAVQSAPKAAPKGKGKAKVESQYVTVAEITLTEYLSVSLSVKKTGESNSKGYALLEFNNPKRQGGGKAAYGKVWLYRKEFIAVVNWLRDAKFNAVLAQLDASGLTNA